MASDKLVKVDDKKTAAKREEEIPDFLRGQKSSHQDGMENVESGDLLLPRLGLCQSLSPQRRKSAPEYIVGLEEGQLFNTVTKEIYGESLEIIMLFFFKNRIKYFPIDDGGGIDCISANGIDGGRISPVGCASCRFSTWGNGATDDEHGNDPPACTLYHNYMAYPPQDEIPGPIAISYKSTGISASKQLLAKVRLTQLPMYAKRYVVEVVTARSGDNEWFEKKITPLGYVDQNTMASMKELFNQMKDANIHVDTTGESGDAGFDHGANAGSTEL
jgi:hypothetical protein